MTTNAPLVSAILPVYNRPQSVVRSIESVFDQSYPDVELIIVDDGSTDETPAVLERYRGSATILRQENCGPYVARNRAVGHAKGDLIAFIDSDDAWLFDKLERQVPLMAAGVGLVYGDIHIVAQPGGGASRSGSTGFRTVTPHRGHVLDKLAGANFVPTCTALVRRSALEEIGGFAVTSRISADYLAWFRIARRYAFDYVDAPVAEYALHKGGISYDLGQALAERIILFRGELDRTNDPETRRIINRLLFNLGLHLALATARGRARNVEHPLRLACAAAAATLGSRHALSSTAAFAMNQIRTRSRRLWS